MPKESIAGRIIYYHCTAHELVMRMIKAVLKETGITATGGIGTNLYLAKIAMDIVAKKISPDADGVRIAELDEMSYREKLWKHRPLTDFWRIGRGTAARLEKEFIFTMGDIARRSLMDEEWFYTTFGIDGELIVDHAWGLKPTKMADIKAYKPSTNSLGAGQVLSCPYTVDKAAVIVREMTEVLVFDLLEKQLVTNGIVLDIGYDREKDDNGSYHGPTITDHYGRQVPKAAHGITHLRLADDCLRNRNDKVTSALVISNIQNELEAQERPTEDNEIQKTAHDDAGRHTVSSFLYVIGDVRN